MHASRQGLGFVLQQQSNDITWNLIQAGSHFLTETESCYAVIELEMLAVAMLGYTEMQALLDRVAALFCHYRP